MAFATKPLLHSTNVNSQLGLSPSLAVVSSSLGFISCNRRFSKLSLRGNLTATPKASTEGSGIVPADDNLAEDGVSLGTLKLPSNTDIQRFESLLFQWANSLCQGANLPLPVPLKVDKVEGGVRLGFITIGDGKTEVLVYIDCLVFPSNSGSGPIFRAIRNGAMKDQPPPDAVELALDSPTHSSLSLAFGNEQSIVKMAASSLYTRCLTPKLLILYTSEAHGNRRAGLSISTPTSPRSRIFCSSTKDSSSAGDIPSNFCIIEGPETLQDFVQMQTEEIQDNIRSRRNKIFLLMEEVRRLRIQQRLKSIKVIDENGQEEADEMPDIQSSIPFLPHMTPNALKKLYLTSLSFISGIIVFGGFIAPTLELKLGLGGTSYEDFIRNMHLPLQLSQVDPIVASFSGGAVGVISALMLIEANNVEQQEKKRCRYCNGTGYLACGRCSASGVCLSINPISPSSASDHSLRVRTTQRCPNCSGAGKVMCPTCLCTGMVMASEHDPRIDPFD
ncbi:hypothetical protein FNV43_RR15546 [Rhamnella rubrinervis]|uniref:DUF7148 domain-containing protein n=1 Tax=Rhamnella rubrinervis TaxID=2594499 RepID=A0A8K0E7K7_9ROSA|nr:hypothetical protein FNV43_RR15546 [Rhamnella rubrinervis]